MRRLIIVLAVLTALALAVFYVLTIPGDIEAAALPAHKPDLKNGEQMFYAGGCASCHAAPKNGKCDDPAYEDAHRLGGGRCLKTPYGIFYVPNISPDREDGIGRWSLADFIAAMRLGVAPGGKHLYPAFPYSSYQRMRDEDLIDLKAFLDALQPVKGKAPRNALYFPFNIRRGLGLWQLVFLDHKRFQPDPAVSAQINRGAYLVEGPGHCGQCHTPRNVFGAMKMSRWLAGAPALEGKGFVSNLTPGGLKWSAKDIAYALESGFTPDFDVLGGSMTAVQKNMAKLTPEDRAAIAAYLKALPALPTTPH